MKTDALIIFIKNPILGQVKTRIEKASNPEKALSVYLALTLITQKFVLDLPCSKYLYYSNFIDLSDSWSNDLFYKMKQVEGDLGIRMQQAFKDQESRSDKTILIGSDCPYLTKAILHEAFKSLDEHDVVLGPTQDGGYYLIGMKKLHAEIFINKSWSTSLLYSQTLETLNDLRLSYFELVMLEDIDYIEDWEKYLQLSSDTKI